MDIIAQIRAVLINIVDALKTASEALLTASEGLLSINHLLDELEDLILDEPELPPADSFWTPKVRLNFRNEPRVADNIIRVLNPGEKLGRIGQSGVWYSLLDEQGVVGWCHSDYLDAWEEEPTSYSKLGSHFNTFPPSEDVPYVKRGRFHLVNASVEFAIELLEANPDMEIIFRDWGTEYPGPDPNRWPVGASSADGWWNAVKNTLFKFPQHLRQRIYVMGLNEPPKDMVNHQQSVLCAFEERRMDYLENNGFKAALFNFSPGLPEIEDPNDAWPGYENTLCRAANEGHALIVHEYWHVKPNDDGWVTTTVKGREAGWLVLRYRLLIDKHLKNWGIENLKIGIGECGRGGNPDGWKLIMTAQQYVDQLKWYDQRLREDPQVIGAAVFLHGLYGPDDQWWAFDISGEAARLMYDYVAE